MASSEQRARRRAQRETARRLREPGGYKPVLRRETSRARESHREYLNMLLDNPDAIRPEDHKMLARQASYAYWEGKEPGRHPGTNERYEVWSEFFYHREG
jgi:hypothetical protein